MSYPLPWPELEKMTWKQRNAAVEAALRQFLTDLPDTQVLTTQELAERLVAEDGRKLVGITLSKLARWMPRKMATHDGETFIAYGKTRTRWRWHGQAQSVPMEWEV